MTYRSPSLVLGSVSILNCPLSFPLVTSNRAFQLEVFTKSLSSTGILVTSTFSWFSWTLALYCFKQIKLIHSLKIKYHIFEPTMIFSAILVLMCLVVYLFCYIAV